MTVTFREANATDADSICQVVCRSITECCQADHSDRKDLISAWLQNKTPAHVLGWLSQPNAYSVMAEEQGSAVGFGLAVPGEIKLCYVVPKVRFTGVGQALLRALESGVIHSGARHIQLESTRSALSFYQRNGYALCGEPIQAFGLTAQPMRKLRPEKP